MTTNAAFEDQRPAILATLHAEPGKPTDWDRSIEMATAATGDADHALLSCRAIVIAQHAQALDENGRVVTIKGGRPDTLVSVRYGTGPTDFEPLGWEQITPLSARESIRLRKERYKAGQSPWTGEADQSLERCGGCGQFSRHKH